MNYQHRVNRIRSVRKDVSLIYWNVFTITIVTNSCTDSKEFTVLFLCQSAVFLPYYTKIIGRNC
ncbi:hypothetical protein DERP_013097 [Dermatophagoides pteronyssinus]|uniref:Uncharacterized protein n=1 Tax=Dermatophagoides pteronyssinus TaxID=6956 RepID=A0ABQ8J5Q7_DERPT|nr:hypothetical protein DERP_013097 [Dermatophagoides pteronyssinus]